MNEPNDGTVNGAGGTGRPNSAAPRIETDSDHRALAIETLRRGPVGAVAVASIAVLGLLIIWYAFYFFAYLPRT
jgi:hypothetical protein